MYVQNRQVQGESIGTPYGDVQFDKNGLSQELTEDQYDYLTTVPGYEAVEVEVQEHEGETENGEPKAPTVQPRRPARRGR